MVEILGRKKHIGKVLRFEKWTCVKTSIITSSLAHNTPESGIHRFAESFSSKKFDRKRFRVDTALQEFEDHKERRLRARPVRHMRRGGSGLGRSWSFSPGNIYGPSLGSLPDIHSTEQTRVLAKLDYQVMIEDHCVGFFTRTGVKIRVGRG